MRLLGNLSIFIIISMLLLSTFPECGGFKMIRKWSRVCLEQMKQWKLSMLKTEQFQ